MAIKNQPLTVNFTVWNTATNDGEPGDTANLTLRLIKDGAVPVAPTNAVSEPDATNMKGTYQLALTAAEMNVDFSRLGGISSTADVVVIPLDIITEQGRFDSVKLDPSTHTGAIIPTVTDVTNRVTANSDQLAGSTAAATNLAASAETIVLFTVGAGSTTTVIQTNLTEATADHYIGRVAIGRTGALAGQATKITDSDGAGALTVDQLTEAPADGDDWVIV